MHYFTKLFLSIKEFLKMYMVRNGYVILLVFLLLNHLLTVLGHLEVPKFLFGNSIVLNLKFLHTHRNTYKLVLFPNQSEQFLMGCVRHFHCNKKQFIYYD